MKKTVSAIVPVFNEQKTVRGVVELLLTSDLITEVICVNDGSSDKSLEVLESFGSKIKLINLKRNRGKGFALVSGIKKSKGELVAFFDSDFPNLSLKHVETLLKPILEENFRAAIGVPKASKNDYLAPWTIYFAGERAYYKKDLLPHLERMAQSRYGVETYLNPLFDKKETKIVPLDGLILVPKQAKWSSAQALKGYLAAAMEIAQEIGRQEGLLPEDKRIIAGLVNVVNFKELSSRVKKIQSIQMRQFLEKYVLKYIKKGQRWWKDFN